MFVVAHRIEIGGELPAELHLSRKRVIGMSGILLPNHLRHSDAKVREYVLVFQSFGGRLDHL